MQLIDGADFDEAFRKYCDVNPTPVSWREINRDEIPQDRTYRNAWRDTGTAIEHNMTHARGIHMDRIRRQRDRELVKLDVPFMRAMESGNGAEKAIAGQKRHLRDLPANFDLTSATTVEELSRLWPEGLPRDRPN